MNCNIDLMREVLVLSALCTSGADKCKEMQEMLADGGGIIASAEANQLRIELPAMEQMFQKARDITHGLSEEMLKLFVDDINRTAFEHIQYALQKQDNEVIPINSLGVRLRMER